MPFTPLPLTTLLNRLEPPIGKVSMVLDTDTYNEVDDQFAVVQALLSPNQLDVKAIYAAPFHNNRSTGAGDGMEKSYEELERLLTRINRSITNFVYRGSTRFMADHTDAVESEATQHLIELAMNSGDEPLYVVAIGAPTNISSALVLEPKIREKIVVVWLGGNTLTWPTAREFNLQQDPPASQILFDSGVPLVLIPCMNVASHLLTTVAEIERYVEPQGAIGAYLSEVFKAYSDDHFGWAKEIWDISAISYLLNPKWVPTELVHSPILTDQLTWSLDNRRHVIRVASHVHRNPIFADLFMKLTKAN